jgi:hypothetical protein
MHTDRPSTTNSSNTQQTTAAAPATGSSSAPAPTSARPVIKVNVEAPDQPDIKINQRTAINVNQPPVPSPSAGTPHSTLGRGVVIEMKKPTSDTGAKIEETNRTTENDKAA